nr:unnamed protein product [Callosobruchus analis]
MLFISDIIRGGVNIFGKTIDRIINTFVRIEDRLRALLELFRKQLKGFAEDVTIKHISKFVVDRERFSDLGQLRFKLDLNLTFPIIKVNGLYKVAGLIGNSFQIHGEGPFRLNLIDLKLGTSTILKFNLPARLRVQKIDLKVKLTKLENNFEGLMNDSETGALINKAISKLAPEALDILWPEIKPSVEAQVKKVRSPLSITLKTHGKTTLFYVI